MTLNVPIPIRITIFVAYETRISNYYRHMCFFFEKLVIISGISKYFCGICCDFFLRVVAVDLISILSGEGRLYFILRF